MRKIYKTEEKLTSEGTELRQPAAELEAPETERKQIEEALRESEEKYRTIFENVNDVVVRLDKRGKVIDANKRIEDYFGYKPNEIIGKNFIKLGALSPKDLPKIVKLFGERVEGKPLSFIELEVKRKDGSIAILEANTTLIKKDGKIEGTTAIIRDITERKAKEKDYQGIIQTTTDGFWIVDTKGHFLDVNDAYCALIGYSREELLNMSIPDIEAAEMPEEVARRIQQIIKTGHARFETRHRCKSGRMVDIEISTTYAGVGDDRFFVFARDITERKQTEEVLQAEKNKLQSVIDAIEYSLTIMDKDFNIIYQSQPSITTGDYYLGEKCYQVYEGQDKVCDGCPVEKAFRDGKSHSAERRIVLPSGEAQFLENTASPIRDTEGRIVSCLEVTKDITERKRVEEAVRESEEKLRKTFESVTDGILVIDLNGVITEVNQRTLEMHGFSSKDKVVGKSAFELVAPCDHERVAKNMRKALKQGTVRGVEYTLLKSGGSEFPGELSTSVLKDASGNPVGHVTISRDITERKQAEEREKELQQELLLSSRLASIGELAAGVAHQINNPLTGVLGFSQRLLRKSTDEEVSQDLKRIYTEAERAAKVVQHLLTFARRRESNKQYSDINEVLHSALELRAYELKTSNIETVTDLAPSLPQIMLDFHQIQEVFLNIILNAEQAMTEANSGGRLTIKTEERKGYIRTMFTDDGPGIPAEHLDKLFDPFFSTRGERGGTGLGLSVCHGIITEHGGRIYAKSKPGKGATFFVELPVNTSVGEKGGDYG